MRFSRTWLVCPILALGACGSTENIAPVSPELSQEAVLDLVGSDGFQGLAWSLDLAAHGYVDEAVWTVGDLALIQSRAAEGGDGECVIHAVDLESGVPRWMISLPAAPTQAPGAGAGFIAFACGGKAVVVSAKTGARTSPGSYYDLDFWASASPAVSGDTLYLASYVENRVESVSLANGIEGWNYRCSDLVDLAPVIAGSESDQSLVVVASDGEISALPLRAALGSPPEDRLWQRMINGRNTVDPVVDGSTVFVAAGDTFVYAINGLTGSVLWKCPCSASFEGPLVLGGDTLYVKTTKGFMAIDVASGTEKWMAPGLERLLASGDNRVYVETAEGSISIRSKDDGSEQSCLVMSGLASVASNGHNGVVVCGDGNGNVYGLN